jgi:hypothetical protein
MAKTAYPTTTCTLTTVLRYTRVSTAAQAHKDLPLNARITEIWRSPVRHEGITGAAYPRPGRRDRGPGSGPPAGRRPVTAATSSPTTWEW